MQVFMDLKTGKELSIDFIPHARRSIRCSDASEQLSCGALKAGGLAGLAATLVHILADSTPSTAEAFTVQVPLRAAFPNGVKVACLFCAAQLITCLIVLREQHARNTRIAVVHQHSMTRIWSDL